MVGQGNSVGGFRIWILGVVVFSATLCDGFLQEWYSSWSKNHHQEESPWTLSNGYSRQNVRKQEFILRAIGNEEVAFTIHHTAIKTRNITNAIQFYSLLGFEPVTKFRAGPAKAAWLEQPNAPAGSSRLELIEVPSFLLNEPEGKIFKAPDLIENQIILGQNHLALDVTASIQSIKNVSTLAGWLHHLNDKSIEVFGKTLRIAVEPYQTMMGKGVYELAFLYDADGALIELLHKQSELEQEISSGWDPLEEFKFTQ